MEKEKISTIVNIMGYDVNIFGVTIVLFFIGLGIAFYRALRSERLNWVDMITRDGRKVSLTKMLQLMGGFAATWIVIKMTLTKELNWDIFAIYLAYVAGVDGFSKFMTMKYSNGGGGVDHGYNQPVNKPWLNRQTQQQDYQESQISQEDARPTGSAKAE